MDAGDLGADGIRVPKLVVVELREGGDPVIIQHQPTVEATVRVEATKIDGVTRCPAKVCFIIYKWG